MILFAIPYAGGHSLVYRNLKTLLEPSIELKALEPPGRGKRVKEKLITDINLIADDLFNHIQNEIRSDKEYGIFGHSMGSLIAYLVTKKIVNANLPLPKHVFCSGHGAPSVPKIDLTKDVPKHTASSNVFWDYIDSLGALPPELKEHKELMNYFEPIIRADIQALELYEYEPIATPLPINMTVLYGIKDVETLVPDIMPWQNESKYPVEFIPVSGGHFGIFDELERISVLIHTKLG